MKGSLESKYCYKGTNILINKLGIKNEKKLERVESEIITVKLAEMHGRYVNKQFTENDLKYINKYLFGDIFDFAGNYRDENIAKSNFKFADCIYIRDEIKRVFKHLSDEKYLKGLDKKQLSERLAYYLAELNVLHPFREGNGRTIREFIRQLSVYNGYNLNWSKVEYKEILESSIKSTYDISDLQKVIYNCL